MKIGVLALQGDFEAHRAALSRLGAPVVGVRTSAELAGVDALVIPGGESTTIRRIASGSDLLSALRERARAGLPVFGTCAGMIACATRIDGEEPLLGIIDLAVRRNAYGRQVDSFETDVAVAGVGVVRAIFIRAPWVEEVGPSVEPLAEHRGRVVAARQGPVLVTSFHPELTDDTRLHRLFLDMI